MNQGSVYKYVNTSAPSAVESWLALDIVGQRPIRGTATEIAFVRSLPDTVLIDAIVPVVDFRCRSFDLDNADEKALYEKVMDGILNNVSVLVVKRLDAFPRVYLEWQDIYYKVKPGVMPDVGKPV